MQGSEHAHGHLMQQAQVRAWVCAAGPRPPHPTSGLGVSYVNGDAYSTALAGHADAVAQALPGPHPPSTQEVAAMNNSRKMCKQGKAGNMGGSVRAHMHVTPGPSGHSHAASHHQSGLSAPSPSAPACGWKTPARSSPWEHIGCTALLRHAALTCVSVTG